MNRELYIHTLRMLRDQYHAEHLDTEAEALEAAISALEQPELIEQGAYVRGFEQGRTQGMLDAKLQPTCNQLATDTISRQAAIDAVEHITSSMSVCVNSDERHGMKRMQRQAVLELANLPSAQPEPQWIPFKTRPLTEEEQDEYPEWDCILDCKLPDDGQAILVSINLRGHERVQYDEFYTDDGSYLESGYAIGAEATAWMPLPEPWRGEEHGTTL